MDDESVVPYTVSITVLVEDMEGVQSLLDFVAADGVVVKFTAEKSYRTY